MSVWPLPQILYQDLTAVQEKRPVALLATDAVRQSLESELKLPVLIQAEPQRYDRELFDFLADNLPAQVKVIYALGEGAPVAAAKIVAARNDVPLVIVPTALESVQCLTPHALVEEGDDDDKRLVEVETGPAAQVIIDWNVIQNAPSNHRAAGIVDVLSIVTGLLDWRFAAQNGQNPRSQRFSPWAAGVVTGLAKLALKHAQAIGQGSSEELETLFNMMQTVVQVCNQLGHSRACEGGEHYLARILASVGDGELSHAERVGPCLLFVAALHGQAPDPLKDAMHAAGIPLDRIKPADLGLVLKNLRRHLEAYGFPYSILNTLDPQSEQAQEALKAAGLELPADTWDIPPQERWDLPERNAPLAEAPHEEKELP